jgi:glycosyltransferase involved in cell wall biosynthesis
VRVLHLFANWKWTGPAEPAVNLAATLASRGHDVQFACGREVAPLPNHVAIEATARGLARIRSLRLGKHRHPIYDPIDRRALKALIAKLAPDVVHCHLANDHRLAAGALRGSSIPLVRSIYDGDPPRSDRDTQALFTHPRQGLVTISERVRDGVISKFGVAPERCVVIEGAVDLKRFNPRRRRLPDLRVQYGLEPDDFVVGIVARMQRHRRFEIFFEALSRVALEVQRLKILLVGRGTWMDEVAVKPAARKELVGKAIFTGYRRGSEYVATLRCMNVKVYLTPGSDGSCRAVREALAMGVPVIAARRGHLQDIIEDGVNGHHVDDDPEQLASMLVRLATDTEERERLSRNAHKNAHKRFGLQMQAETMESFYDRILSAGG